MGEDAEMVKKTKTWVKVGGIISGGIVTILTPLIVMYVEVKPQVDEAQAGASSSYEAIVPAIVEMQDILDEAAEWSEGTDEYLDEVEERFSDLDAMDRRLVRCETYIDILSKNRRFPEAPGPMDDPPVNFSGRLPPEPRKVQHKAQYAIPKDFKNAKAKVKARKSAKCSPDDPLCGALE